MDKVQSYDSIRDYMIRGRVEAWNKIYRRDFILGNKLNFPKGLLYEDVEFSTRPLLA